MLKNTLIVAAAMAAVSSQATLIVNEPFKFGTDRTLNQYNLNLPLNNYGVLTADSGLVGRTGTVNPWSQNSSNYLIPATGTPAVSLPGLTDADVAYEQGTMTRWAGTTNDTGFLRQANRQLVAGYTTASTYYFSIMMKRENWTNPTINIAGVPTVVTHDDSLAGFTSAASGSGLKGFMVGYQSGRGAGGTGEFPSLVIKAGNINIDPVVTGVDGQGLPATADQNLVVSGTDSTFARTYTFVVKMDVNLSGPETFTYWVDDDVTTTNWGNELLATATAKYKGTFTAEAMTSLSDINRILMASPASSGAVNYDEFRMATSLESVTGVPNVLIPEPSSMGLLALAIPALRRRRA